GGEPMLASVSVRALVGESLGHLGKAMPLLKAEERIAPDIWPVRGDYGQLRTVIRNIYYNAAEAMPEGGTMVIEAENLPAGPGGGQVANPLGRDAVRISLTDHGVGIPPEIINRIFDPYFTTCPKGAAKGKGLGLALCHTIISRHQGQIDIKSQLGQGTTVSLTLPAATAP
ncbi:MAG: ATP-binding protein, partial [Desulfobacteraceae bacterium]|nr:ATP-binding protein [Desulfobacteraceae bacterium]